MTRLLKDLQAARDRAEDMRDSEFSQLCDMVAAHVTGEAYHAIMQRAQHYGRLSRDAARWHERISTLLELGEAK